MKINLSFVALSILLSFSVLSWGEESLGEEAIWKTNKSVANILATGDKLMVNKTLRKVLSSEFRLRMPDVLLRLKEIPSANNNWIDRYTRICIENDDAIRLSLLGNIFAQEIYNPRSVRDNMVSAASLSSPGIVGFLFSGYRDVLKKWENAMDWAGPMEDEHLLAIIEGSPFVPPDYNENSRFTALLVVASVALAHEDEKSLKWAIERLVSHKQVGLLAYLVDGLTPEDLVMLSHSLSNHKEKDLSLGKMNRDAFMTLLGDLSADIE